MPKVGLFVFVSIILVPRAVTRGGVEAQFAPNPVQAGCSPNRTVRDGVIAKAPGDADVAGHMLHPDRSTLILSSVAADALTGVRETAGVHHSYNGASKRTGGNSSDRIVTPYLNERYLLDVSSHGRIAASKENADAAFPDHQGSAAGGDVCNDGNICTDDTVDRSGQCLHSYNSRACDDNSVCTANDYCVNGSCTGTSSDCDDGNICTDDSCNPLSGCTYANNSNPCDDGVFCNGTETCSAGVCGSSSGFPCQPEAICDEDLRSCDSMADKSVISFQAVRINNVAITPGTCNLAVTPPRCSTGNVDTLCASDDECHVGTNHLIPDRCAGGLNINDPCTTNAHCPGSTCVSVFGGDTIELEFFLSSWADEVPAGVRYFQVKLDRTRFVSPDNGTATPLGWCAPLNNIPCTQSAPCLSAYPICSPPPGCTCAGHNPDIGGFMTTSRKDYLFNGLGALYIIDTSSVEFRYVGLTENERDAVQDTGLTRYLGSLILKVSLNACGTFAIGSVEDLTSTFIASRTVPPNNSYTVLPTLHPLFITMSDCSRQLQSCNPGHCHLDARIAHDRLDPQIRLNSNSIKMTFSKSTTVPLLMAPADFEISLFPALSGDVPPFISSITPDPEDPKKTTVYFDRPVQQNRWTCIRDRGSNKRCCTGSLPGDADGNRRSQTGDRFELYDNLQGGVLPPLRIEKCDTDRSLQCTPADLLMVVDLLNGADSFTEVNGDALEECPTMRPPP